MPTPSGHTSAIRARLRERVYDYYKAPRYWERSH
jgi:hypothetical protein